MIAAFRSRPFAEQALLVGAAASALLLAGAHVFEAFGYAPCPLCLDQREAHWLALAVGAAGFLASFLFKARLAAAAAVGAAAMVYAVSAALSGYHTGVEWKFWPGPTSCSGAGAAPTTIVEIEKGLSEKVRGPACEAAQWRLFGVSMAGYNFLISSGLMALTFGAAASAARAERRARRSANGAVAGARAAGDRAA
jgi:disulfide bond formation protein DsbB